MTCYRSNAGRGRSDEVQERQGVLPDVQRMRSQGCVVGVYQDISGI